MVAVVLLLQIVFLYFGIMAKEDRFPEFDLGK